MRLRGLDGAIAYVAANISNPFVAPFLFTGEVQVGALLLDHHVIRVDDGMTLGRALRAFPVYLAVGSPVVAVGLALIGGLVTYAVVELKRVLVGAPKPRPRYALPANAPAWVVAAERVANRYASPVSSHASARAEFHYVRIKLVMDPIAKIIADIAGDGPCALGDIADVGTGRGQLPILLLELGRAASAFGVDWDARKIAIARAAAKADVASKVSATFERGDARDAAIPLADTVLLIDLLHYFKLAEQDAILRNAARAVRPGGRLVVREADTERGVRSFITLMEERIFTFVRFNRGERVVFRPARDIARVLREEGLEPRIEPAWGKTPFSNVLIVGTRAPLADPSESARSAEHSEANVV